MRGGFVDQERLFSYISPEARVPANHPLQKSMLAMIGDAQHPERADPKYWAPFVGGEPAKPAN